MFNFELQFLLVLSTFQVIHTERRISGGRMVERDHKFMVYLVNSVNAIPAYDAWLCGGAIVSKLHVVTSAACVEDVNHIYAIAGYRRYVTAEELNTDICTKDTKKRVVLFCVPRMYSFDYDRVENWAQIDIAVLKVESPFSFDDPPANGCSYGLSIIPINFDPAAQKAGASVFALGWGHNQTWRQENDSINYNQDILRYVATNIMSKKECMTHYARSDGMMNIIEKYMICTNGSGNFNEDGDVVDPNIRPKLKEEGCDPAEMRKLGLRGCIDNRLRASMHRPEDMGWSDDRTRRDFEFNQTRRQGICQNDHGGPLIGWLRGKQVLLGVASVFKVDKLLNCKGPYLFTSTECNGAFLDCLVFNGEHLSGRRSPDICNSPPALRGYHIQERKISWKDHPDGIEKGVCHVVCCRKGPARPRK